MRRTAKGDGEGRVIEKMDGWMERWMEENGYKPRCGRRQAKELI